MPRMRTPRSTTPGTKPPTWSVAGAPDPEIRSSRRGGGDRIRSRGGGFGVGERVWWRGRGKEGVEGGFDNDFVYFRETAAGPVGLDRWTGPDTGDRVGYTIFSGLLFCGPTSPPLLGGLRLFSYGLG
jgi:hypothetical protein